MSIVNPTRFVITTVDGDTIKNKLLTHARFVNQKPYKGNPTKGLAPGVNVTLQITEDNTAPIIDRETGEVKNNSVFETVDVTIVGVSYPLPIAKGDYVEVGKFIPESSYYIDYNLILRYDGIKKIPAPNTSHEKT